MKDKIVFGICGSFCNHQKIIKVLKDLVQYYDIYPVVTHNVYNISTRFYKNTDFINDLQDICKHKVMKELNEVELIGPENKYDLMVIAPMSATVLSKLVNGNYDNPVTLAAKAMLRNNKNVVIGIACNDALSISGVNLMRLIAMKNIYSIPFRQDDCIKKPTSLVSDFDLCKPTIELAMNNIQIQPLVLGSDKNE